MDLATYTELYAGLLVAYVAYATWAGLDPRIPFAGALVLVLGGAAVVAYGDPGTGEVLGVFGFLTLLAGFAAGLLPERWRRRTRPGGPKPAEPVDQRQSPPDPALHDLQQQPVAVVDGPGEPDGEPVRGPEPQAQGG